MTKKNKNNFVSYIEDSESLFEESKKEEVRYRTLNDSTVKKMNEYNHSLLIIYVMVGLLLVGVVSFWWNINRDKFYAAIDQPIEHSAVQSMFYKLNILSDSKNQIIDDMEVVSDIDLNTLIEKIDTSEVNNEGGEEIDSINEDLLLKDLKGKVEDKNLEEDSSDILELDN